MLRCMTSELAKLERTQNRTFGQTLRAKASASLTSSSALSSPKTIRSGRVRWRSSTRTDGASPTTRIIGFSLRNECKAFAISACHSMTNVLSGTISRANMLYFTYTKWRIGKNRRSTQRNRKTHVGVGLSHPARVLEHRLNRDELVVEDFACNVQQAPNGRVADGIDDACSLTLGLHEVPSAQESQLLGERRLFDLEALAQLPDADRAVPQFVQDLNPEGVPQDLEEVGFKQISQYLNIFPFGRIIPGRGRTHGPEPARQRDH